MALRPDQTPPQQTPKTPRQPGSWLRLALLAGLSLYIVILLSPFLSRLGGPARVDMSYSQLLTQIDSGNVADITIQGQSAQGDLKTSFTNNGVTNTQFSTTLPDNVGLPDPSFFTLLKNNHVATVVKPDTGGIGSLLLSFLPFLALIAIWIWFMRRSGQAAQGIFSFGRSRARMQEPGTPKTTFHDVAGVEQAQFELQEMVDFLRDPQKFQRLGGRMPKGVLLIGPPGTGKTLLARAIAGEAKVPFFTISGSDFVEMFVGVGASRVRDMFEQAKKNAPCIIFIDEIDAVGRHRGAGLGGGNDEREQTLNQLLVEMDGFEANEGVILIAATNRPDVLDPALLRPGRFDRQVVVPNPDVVGRENILKVHVRKVPMAPDVNLKTVARGTPGFSGADLANLVNEAALMAARRNKRMVTQHEFEDAKDKVMMGSERRSLVMTEEEKLLTAYHEGGHAIVALKVGATDPVHKATIIPRGRALGMVMQLPERDKLSMSYEQMTSRLAIMMGGRVAEEIVFGRDKVTSGAASDIEQATKLARMMVTRWGLSEELGAVAYGENQEEVFLGYSVSRQQNISEDTVKKIDSEIKRFVEGGLQLARKILTENRAGLEILAKGLIEYETLTGDEIKDLLIGKPPVREGVSEPSTPRASAVPPSGKPRPRPETGGLEPQPQA
ncbi:MAG TPA: ATP-dependent zinc metalloprotease FtsH [Xanthobacteraceae bacterium]|nr:ATP-dependent zinc metalloprotease FtsH [Xanthobacteraceae bacterium]